MGKDDAGGGGGGGSGGGGGDDDDYVDDDDDNDDNMSGWGDAAADAHGCRGNIYRKVDHICLSGTARPCAKKLHVQEAITRVTQLHHTDNRH